MKLNDPSFLSFAGEPITGRIPPRTLVAGNGALTPQQQAGVAHAFKLFKDATRVSVGGYLVRNRVLPDGTLVRMESQGTGGAAIDTVYVVPPPPPDGLRGGKLPHGFLVTSSYSTPKIYCRAIVNDAAVWSFAGDFVPQAVSPLRATNQAFIPPGDPVADSKAYVHPTVLTEPAGMWDWARHGGAAAGVVNVVPITLVVRPPVGARSRAHLPHYAVNDTIVRLDGTVLFQMTDAYPGWLPVDAQGPPSFMTPATDSTGTLAGLFSYREREIAGTARYNVQYRNVLVKRTAPTTYVADGDHQDSQFIVPLWSAQTTVVEASTADLDGDAATANSLNVTLTATTGTLTAPNAGEYEWKAEFGSGWLWSKLPLPAASDLLVGEYGFTEEPVSNAGAVVTMAGYTDKQVTAAAAPTELPIARLPRTDSAMDVGLSVNVAYTVDRYMRGGTGGARLPNIGYGTGGGQRMYGTVASNIDRRDSRYKQEGAVSVTLKLPGTDWNPTLKLFDGTSLGNLTGSKRFDTHYRWVDMNMWGSILYTGTGTPEWDGWEGYEGLTYTVSGGSRFYQENPPGAGARLYRYGAIQATLRGADEGPRIHALKVEGVATVTDVDTYDAPVCVGNYDYTSRYIIDFDLRALFYAAIVVRVQCSGARWDQSQSTSPSNFIGALTKTSDPSYTVTISLETDTNGVKVTKQLITESCTRAPFEFDEKRYTNPFRYPYIDSQLDLIFYMPPKLSPTVDFYHQLRTLSTYQGSNPHLAGEDFFKSMVNIEDFKSLKGIEYSHMRDGLELPHSKFVQGTLYARTFKLSEFPDALWMLRSLKMDAPLNNLYPQPPEAPAVLWYYLPLIGAAIADTEYSVETRDGVLVDWTTDIVPKPDTAVPALKSARNIQLYRI